MEKHTPKSRQVTSWTGIWRKTWCGPYAVAVVTGKEYEHCYQALKKIRGKRPAKGVPMIHIVNACKIYDRKVEYTELQNRRKMSKFCKEQLEPNSLYIIQISQHVLVIDTRDWTVIDNQSQEWTAMENYHGFNKQVKGYIKIHNPAIGTFHDNLELDFYNTRRVA